MKLTIGKDKLDMAQKAADAAAEKLAELRGLTLEEIHRITTENGKRLYRI